MLAEENYPPETHTIQISTCRRYASICFSTREILNEFCSPNTYYYPVPTSTLNQTSTPESASPSKTFQLNCLKEKLKTYQNTAYSLEKPTVQESTIKINILPLEQESITVSN